MSVITKSQPNVFADASNKMLRRAIMFQKMIKGIFKRKIFPCNEPVSIVYLNEVYFLELLNYDRKLFQS